MEQEGSSLGSKALVNISKGKEKKNISFYDNIDPDCFKNSVEKLDLDRIGCIVISKSGTTTETLSQFACLIEIINQKKQLEVFCKNCLIITEKNNNPLRKIGMQYKCEILDHEIEIGGRYSVFSNVGMVPAIIAGIDVKKIHAGVKDLLAKINIGSFNDHLKVSKFLTSKKFLTQN